MDDFEHFWQRIQTLRKFELTALHYLKLSNGIYKCLNTNSMAATEEDLDFLVAWELEKLKDEDVLPFAPKEFWEKFAAKAPPSMNVGATKTSDWRRRAILAGIHLTIVGNSECQQ